MKAQIISYDSQLRKYVNCLKVSPGWKISDTTERSHTHSPPFLQFKANRMCKVHHAVIKLNENNLEKEIGLRIYQVDLSKNSIISLRLKTWKRIDF